MINYPVVDSHVHLLDPDRFGYAWTAGAPVLKRRALPADLDRAAEPHKVDTIVFVEVDVDHPQHLGEAEWVQELARRRAAPEGHGRGAAARDGQGRRSGARAAPASHHHARRPPADPEPAGPGFLHQAGLHRRPQAPRAARPLLRHLRLPSSPAERHPHGGEVPRGSLRARPHRQAGDQGRPPRSVAARPQGARRASERLLQDFRRRQRSRPQGWTREQLKPYIAHAIECFGFDRVDVWRRLARHGAGDPYPEWVDIVDWTVAGATEEERRKLFRDTAIHFYRLDR